MSTDTERLEAERDAAVIRAELAEEEQRRMRRLLYWVRNAMADEMGDVRGMVRRYLDEGVHQEDPKLGAALFRAERAEEELARVKRAWVIAIRDLRPPLEQA